MLEHNNFKDYLSVEVTELEILKAQLSNSLSDVPEGSLNILTRKSGKSFYFRYFNRKHREYISKKETSLIKQLAQKSYHSMLMNIVDERLTLSEKLLQLYNKSSLFHIYDNMPKARQELISPVLLPDDQYLEKWYAAHPGGQNKLPFQTSYETNLGEHVRSKSEKILADLFYKYNIPYVYEPVLVFSSGRTLCPDFLLLNLRLRKTIAFEHFGMMSDSNYSTKTCEKIILYEKNGFFPGDNLLFSMEAPNTPLDVKLLEKIIERYLL